MKREPVVIDCWFDSGAMPFAQWHYPFQNQEEFKRRYPANFISEALDQTRGWFYTLLAISTLLFDEPSFKNCIVLGLVQDKDGQKMSKHKGNVVDPWTVLDKQGCRRRALVLLHGLDALAPQPLFFGKRFGSTAQIYGNALEYVCVLYPLRGDRRVRSHQAYIEERKPERNGPLAAFKAQQPGGYRG